jgi:hypothetical protein
MASIEAVERRRIARRLRSTSRSAEPSLVKAVDVRRARIAMAMAFKYYRERPGPDDIRSTWLFWQAIRCEVFKAVDFKQPAFIESDPWVWWCGLHWRQRIQLMRLTDKCTSRSRMGFGFGDSEHSADLLNSITLGDVKMKW